MLTNQRNRLTPYLFEAIMFLKVNRRFWDQQLVSEAYKMQRTERSNQRYEDDEAVEVFLNYYEHGNEIEDVL